MKKPLFATLVLESLKVYRDLRNKIRKTSFQTELNFTALKREHINSLATSKTYKSFFSPAPPGLEISPAYLFNINYCPLHKKPYFPDIYNNIEAPNPFNYFKKNPELGPLCILISDLHITTTQSETQDLVYTHLAKKILKLNPKYLFLLGDITDGVKRLQGSSKLNTQKNIEHAFKIFFSYLHNFPGQIILFPGNHDDTIHTLPRVFRPYQIDLTLQKRKDYNLNIFCLPEPTIITIENKFTIAVRHGDAIPPQICISKFILNQKNSGRPTNFFLTRGKNFNYTWPSFRQKHALQNWIVNIGHMETLQPKKIWRYFMGHTHTEFIYKRKNEDIFFVSTSFFKGGRQKGKITIFDGKNCQQIRLTEEYEPTN
jgi:UDP-2,3-diacylglucosamine pyrophosphatase LpxH